MESAVNIPQWEDRVGNLTEPTAFFACIVGRSLGGAVTAKDRQFAVTTVDQDDLRGGRALAFHLHCAEPGDSGSTKLYRERCGAIATIPLFDKLTWLPVSKKKVTKVTLHALLPGHFDPSYVAGVESFHQGVCCTLSILSFCCHAWRNFCRCRTLDAI
jgi:hypothetical protein